MSGRIGTFHRWMALFLSVVMCMSMLPVGSAFAEEGQEVAAEDVYESVAEAVMPDEAETVLFEEPEVPVEETVITPEEEALPEEPAAPAEGETPTEEAAHAEGEEPAAEPAAPAEGETPTDEPETPAEETEQPADPAEEAGEEEAEELTEEEEGEETSEEAADAANFLNTVQITNIVKNGAGLKIVWDPEPEVQYYAIWRQAATETAWTRIKIARVTASATEASYTDPMTAAKNGMEYAYYVQSSKNATGTNNEVSTSPNYEGGLGQNIVPTFPLTAEDSVLGGYLYATKVYYQFNTPVQSKPVVVDKGIQLSWSNVSINTSYTYVVERADTPTGPYSRININPLTALKYVDESALSGTTYYYIVRVMNKAGTDYYCEDPLNPALSINPRYTEATFFSKVSVIPTAQKGVENLYASLSYTEPDGSTRSDVYENYIRVRWKATQDTREATGILQNYKLERMDSITTGEWKDLGAVTVGATCGIDYDYDPSGNTLYYDDFDIANQKVYTYRVKNLDTDKETVVGAWDASGADIVFYKTPYLNTGDPTQNYEVSETGITLYWTRIPGVSKYRIYRTELLPPSGSWKLLTDKAGKVVTVTAQAGQSLVTYTDEYVAAGKSYYYTVVCRDDSDSWDVSPYNDQGILAAFTEMPKLVSAVSVATGIEVTWQLVRDIDDYAIFRRAAGSETWTEITQVNEPYVATTPPKEGSYIDTYAAAHHGIRFYYSVRCLDGGGNYVSSYAKPGVSAVWYAPPVMIEDPALSVAGGIKVVWQESEGAPLYAIYRKTNPAAVWELISVEDASDGGIYYDVSLVNGQETLSVNAEYYYAVGVVEQVAATGDPAVDYELCSALAETAYPAKYYPTPKLVSLESDAAGLVLTWEPVGDATTDADFRVYRKDTANGEFLPVYDGGAGEITVNADNTLSWTDTTVKSGNRYWYTVAVFNGTDDISGYDPVGLSRMFFGVAGFDGIVKLEAVEKGIRLTFKVVDGVPYYQVRRSEASGAWIDIGQPILWNTANSSGQIVYTDTTAVSGAKYNYTVALIGPDGEELGLMKVYPDPLGTPGYFMFFKTPALKSAVIGELVDKSVHDTLPDPNKYGYISFTWQDVDGAAAYNVYRLEGKETEYTLLTSDFLPGDMSKPEYVDLDVKPGVQYTYTVTVSDGMTGADLSGYVAAGVKATFLHTPQVVDTEVSSETKGIMVHWKAIQGCKGYEILRKVDGATYFESVGRVNGYTTQNYLDTKAVAGIKYRYTVRAFNGNIKGGYFYLDADTVAGMFLATPVIRSVEPIGNVTTKYSGAGPGPGLAVTWYDLMNGAYDIEIQEKDDTLKVYAWDDPNAPTGTYTTVTISAPGQADFDELFAKTYSVNPQKYSYRVRVVDNGSTPPLYSAWSATVSATFYPPVEFATVNPIASVLTGNQIYWQKMTGITKYRVYRDMGDGRGFLPLATTTGFTYTDKQSARNPISGVLATYAIVGMIGSKEVTPLDASGSPYVVSNLYVGVTTLTSAKVAEKQDYTMVDILFKPPVTPVSGVEPDMYEIYLMKTAPLPKDTTYSYLGSAVPQLTSKAGVLQVTTPDLSTVMAGIPKGTYKFVVQAHVSNAVSPDGNDYYGPDPLDPAIAKKLSSKSAVCYETPGGVTLYAPSTRLDKVYDTAKDELAGVTGIKSVKNNRGIYTNTLYFETFSTATRYVIYKWDRHGVKTDPNSWVAVGYATTVRDAGTGTKVARYIDKQNARNAVYPDDEYKVCAANGSAVGSGWVDLYP